jgi:hypothetical protein
MPNNLTELKRSKGPEETKWLTTAQKSSFDRLYIEFSCYSMLEVLVDVSMLTLSGTSYICRQPCHVWAPACNKHHV